MTAPPHDHDRVAATTRTGLPSCPRQTEDGYYGPRPSGPNAYAVTAFELGLAGGALISIILAVVALGRIRDTGRSGRRLAIAALVVPVLWLPFEILGIIGRVHGS